VRALERAALALPDLPPARQPSVASSGENALESTASADWAADTSSGGPPVARFSGPVLRRTLFSVEPNTENTMKIGTTKRSNRRGQGMTEYIIIVALISIASIGIVTLFGDNIRRLFAMAADSLAGNESVAQANSVTAVANASLTKKKVANFALNNGY
jgi:pilus assembly protein Flp/PilA